MIPIYSFAAFSGTGKTTFLEQLIPLLKEKGLRVAVMKHDAHDFDIDKEGKDSARFTKAGADITALASSRRAVLMENRPVTAAALVQKIEDVDVILTEGWKTGPWPKIMLHRAGTGKDLPLNPAECLAVVSDVPVDGAKVFFDWTDQDAAVKAVCDFLLERIAFKQEVRRLPEMFAGIKPETAARLRKAGRIREYKKGERIFSAKHSVPEVFVQISGKSCIYNLTHSGQRKVIFIFGKGTLLNDHVMNEHPSSCFCEAIENSRVYAVPAGVFAECMEQDFALTKAVIKMQEWKLWRTEHQLKNTMGSIFMERKLAAKLWKLARDFGIPTEDGIEIDVNLSITFLSDLMGTPRETTSRMCKTLSDKGLIKMNKKRITITDPVKMTALYKEGKFI
ncbi:MAG: molybdopterin-guanine dinucleotide biosynthesis protein B [Erysipelotrichaceae bacterium]|nr:molybdopterin-guanine dinucleotide biosynthesis protein B [Erysipelotrichaceae bacterium]